jgi:hypothetical protein
MLQGPSGHGGKISTYSFPSIKYAEEKLALLNRNPI